MKKLLSLLVGLLVLLSTAYIAFATSFSDTLDHQYETAIEYIADLGIVEGYDDGTYQPDAKINRAEFTKIIINSVYDEDTIESCALPTDVFEDFDHEEWFTPYVCVAHENSIIQGYDDGTFKPNNPINFVEAAKIVVIAFGYETEEADVWYEPYVEVLEDNQAVPSSIGNNDKEITRGEMAEIIYQMLGDDESNETDDSSDLFSLVKTITVSPDDTYQYGAFCRINYVEALDEFVMTFGGASPEASDADDEGRAGGFEGAGGYAYKYYSTDLEETGEHGIYIYGGGDMAGVMVDDVYYHLTGGGSQDWRLTAFDAVTWETLNEVYIELDTEHEESSDQMLAYVNGYFDASGGYTPDPDAEADFYVGGYTFHRLLNADLELVDSFILEDERHINGSSMVYVDGVYHYVTATAYWGDLMLMQYDEDWNYLGSKILVENAQWSQGTIYDEETERFYVTYLENMRGELSQTAPSINAHLSIFDKDWELLDTIEVTDFDPDEGYNAGRPWVTLHEEKIYVSYDMVIEGNYDWQCLVSVYE